MIQELVGQFDVHTYVLIPLAIIVARICDVSIGTIRVIFIAKGYRKMAAVLGFLEIMIWILVGRQVLVKSTSMIHFIAYAAGFGIGNYIGLVIEDKMSLGIVIVRIIVRQSELTLLQFFREENIGYTVADGHGAQGEVKIIFTVVRRQNLQKVITAIRQFNPKAFYSIEDVRTSNAGVFPQHLRRQRFQFSRNGKRKAK